MSGASDRIFSFEFFPPATPEGVTKLSATRAQLAQLGPKFFSVTYGAGGSTRDRTLAAVLDIQASGQRAAPHISCIGSTRDTVRATLATYREHGIGHLVALRGDLPSGSADVGEFRYANELVEFIRETTGDWFHIEVGGDSSEKSKQIWCAKDNTKAWRDWMLKGTMVSDSPQCDSSALQRNFAFGQKHRIRGTPGLVFEDGRSQAGAMNTEQIEKQLAATRAKTPG